ncbi:helix-turn-helix domain-containing protein [Nocardia wallacei]|uniref:helix-turn-helix domain-containing protein n=1 Tax=Nocardia wallacei TaxID=480035 RepID=UPI002457CBE6|nr:helix-turn-helix transcriptional regulator [Nocardia wallacei]
MSVAGSTLARRALGRELRRLRLARNIQQAQAARLAETSPQSISRFEEGRSTRITSFQLNALCDAYGVTDEKRRILLALLQEAKASREHGGRWWRPYIDEMKAEFNHYIALEEAANRLSCWKLAVIPGLLQTPEYRRAVAWTENPNVSSELVERRIEWTKRRQVRLGNPDFQVEFILSETVLRDQMGGPAVMLGQLERMLKVAELPNVSIRIVPFDATGHLGSLAGSFSLLEFPMLPQSRLMEPPIVYVEGYAGDLYLERDEEIQLYRDALREIRRVALNASNSRALILAISKEHQW